ncbi:aldose 1-epimerase [Pengzhenrongella frigida]|uniref:Aldose 1-epimerase n=1 Tax=Pengzhenrongella frigida TaxID=1259133 RepID=A0A4Q5N054_9MICO|nr:aldose 1-epimerase [Cellulomonas sp. HLT2-17]RYV51512.1 aldose 1-epimerase [Cellulomonas sp. HLT2-17]
MTGQRVTPGMFGDEPTVVLELATARLEVALRGATVLRWVVDLGDGPVDLLDGYRTAEELRSQAGIRNGIMAPFCDRVTDARYTFDGVEHDLRPGQADRLVYHGLVRSMPFVLGAVTQDADAVAATFGCQGLVTSPQPGYPFAIEVEVTYRLGTASLAVEIAGHNRGSGSAPFAAGWHPYFRFPGADTIAGLDLQISSDVRVETDPGLIPLPGAGAYTGIEPGAARWEPIGEAVLDVGYVAGGRHAEPTVLRDSASGLQLALTQDRGLVHLFTGDTLDRDRRASIAVEPVETMTDAFNRPDCATAIRLLPGDRRAFRASVALSRLSDPDQQA